MYASVPSICIPLAGGQFINSSLVEHHGIGIYVSLMWIDVDDRKIKNEYFENELINAFHKMFNEE